MAIAQSRVTAQGQISVPASVRQLLAVGPGSLLEWDLDGEQIVLRRVGQFSSEEIHSAVFSKRPARKSLREMEEAIRQHALRKHAGA